MIFRYLFFMPIFIFISFSGHAKTLKIALIDIPPFGFSEDASKGVHVEFMSALLNEADLPYKILIMPYPRAIEALEKGKVDLTLVYKRKDLKNSVQVAQSIGFKNFILSHLTRPLKSRMDLQGKKVTVVRSAKYEDWFDDNSEIKKISVNDYLQSIAMLSNKRVDGAILSEPALYYYKKQKPELFLKLGKGFVLNTKYNYIYAHQSTDKKILQRLISANNKIIKKDPLTWFLKMTGKKDQ